MEPLVKDTYGVYTYQEQLQKSFEVLVGYSPEEADYFREVLAKKKKQEMEKYLPTIRERLLDRGWTADQAEVFIGVCIASSAYSFNLAHSAAYAYNAYMCAFLKNKFPLQWWTAVLRNAKVEDIKEKNYDRAVKDILLMPHVNGPMESFELIDDKVHAPLYLVDGIGVKACDAIKAEIDRAQNQLAECGEAIPEIPGLAAFNSFIDFYSRVKDRSVTSRVMERMIICGAFQHVEPDKSIRQLLELNYYTDRVSGLKAGKGKSHSELLDAALKYQAEHPDEATEKVPQLKLSDIELEILKTSLLPIYRPDVHEAFKAQLENYFSYENGFAKYEKETPEGKATYQVLQNLAQVKAFYQSARTRKQTMIWAGLLKSQSTFAYNDKKTGQRVTALKLFVANGAEEVECVCWPNVYEEFGAPTGGGIIMIVGNVREGWKAGTFQVFASAWQELK
jgi:DNA polymerase III alpha subunit